jgi:hypothetical protein
MAKRNKTGERKKRIVSAVQVIRSARLTRFGGTREVEKEKR